MREPRVREAMTSLPFALHAALALLTAACVSADAPSPTPPPPTVAPLAPPAPAPAPPPAPAPAPPPAPAPVGPMLPGPSYPEGAIAIPCTLRAEIEPTIVRDELRLRFVLVNLGSEAATVTLAGTCPGGVVALQGLPAGFDPMHRCQAGACASPDERATYTIPARKAVTLGETTLRAKGDACNPALPMGSTFLTAAIVTDPRAFDACSGAMVHIVRDPRSGTLRRAGLLDEPVPAVAPRTKPTPKVAPKPKAPQQKPAPRPRKQCPVCAFACPHGFPSRKVGPDGCPSCSCEDFSITKPGGP